MKQITAADNWRKRSPVSSIHSALITSKWPILTLISGQNLTINEQENRYLIAHENSYDHNPHVMYYPNQLQP